MSLSENEPRGRRGTARWWWLRRVIRSHPAAMFWLFLAALYVVELGVVHALGRGNSAPAGSGAAWLDALLVTGVTAALVWLLVVRPMHRALTREQARREVILDTATDAIITINERGTIRIFNRAAEQMFGFSAGEAIGSNIAILVPPPHHDKHDEYLHAYIHSGVKRVIDRTREVMAVRKDGEQFPVELSVSEVRIGADRLFSAIIRDATERHRLSEQVQKMAHYDQLTGLANRALFHDRLAQAVTLARRQRTRLGLLYLDLDRFKAVNDGHGHASGDQVLRVVAERFLSCVRASDTVARLGGDEFGIILGGLRSAHDAEVFVAKLRDAVNQPFVLEDCVITIGVSVGAAMFPDDAEDFDELLKIADGGMYRKKGDRVVAS